MHQRHHEPVPKLHFLNPSPALKWDSTQWMINYSATPNLIEIYLATGNWKFILYWLRLEIQVIVLYNNKLCMFALLWQINTNLSWSTHFLLNGNLLIWYLCFLINAGESWTCIKDTFSAILPLPWKKVSLQLIASFTVALC